ncbi:hypothetical protein HanXRQr2_Chr05g0207681 [Helianthus annuus]|uniref:Uncharacterized protein n=1 Tax=Helianthus annuus TaxID=4232 RepID=A0A9K3J050_HELAN|nr:hypothetical protein HanXRQr2_Chr05g0207681 [Helianthus annuus]KAJ0922177.1 hypothetical protein HanPSC8_Chr05g0200621 [Helianthus annuus]
MTPETIGPRIIARPCPANPKDTILTPMYSGKCTVPLTAILWNSKPSV